jgi:8-oxo-dGTP pyrophosphatase MutT (NUDIX family)
MKPIFVCVVKCYIDDDETSHVLLVHHKDRDGWEFPGGKLEEDDLIDCSNFANLKVYDILKSAHREFIEETESEMIDEELSGIYYNANVGTLFLVCRRTHSPFMEREITTDSSIDYVKEFDLNDLPKMSFPTDNTIIIDALKKSLIF